MRFSSTLPLCGVGLALLATSGSDVQAQQARRAAVRPSEQLSIPPVIVHLDELVELQRSLPEGAWGIDQAPTPTIELSPREIELPRTPRVAAKDLGDEGTEHLGACSVDLLSSKGMASQGDVPDGGNISYIPPDTAGAVGPNHLMTMLNNKVLVQDRLGATVLSLDLLTFWSPLLATATTFPRVNYDVTQGRWIATARSGAGGTMNVLLAVSATNDPTGTWNYYAILADPAGTQFPDWVTQGYNATWIAMTANMFNVTGGAFAGAKMWVVDQASVGGPLTVSVFPTGFMTTVHGSGGSSTMPSRAMDTLDPNLWLVNNSFTSSGVWLLQLTQISGTGPAPTAAGLPGSPFGGTTSFCFVATNFSSTQRTMPQVGDARFITAFSVRTASVASRNGKLWSTQSGGLPGPSTNTSPTSTGVIWHELDPTLPFPASSGAPGSMLVQSSAITGPTASAATMPSIAVNCGEDIILGYSYGDTTRNPECAYSTRLGTDPLNFMGPMTLLKAGDSSYWKNFGVGTTAQWGRYSSSAVDPNDDTTLWTLQEYAAMRVGPADNDSRWGTWWGRVGECGEPAISDQPDALTVCQGDPAMFSVVATSSNGGLAYQWRKDGLPLAGETSSSLSIAATVAGDGGVYDVMVDDGCGSVLSAPALLDFAGAVISQQPMDVHAGIGTSASFTVVASGTGTLMYQWRKNGNPISGANSATYTIVSVTGADYGTYDCIVTDDCGPVLSTSARLKLAIKPNNVSQAELSFHIFEQPASVAGCLGGQVTFAVVAYPDDVTYVWRKDGTPISPPETGSTLTLSGLSNADAGAYDVVVSHGSQSKASDDAILVVDDIPVITDHPDNVDAMLGDDVTFSVTATGAGPLQYQWEKKSNPFVPFQPIAGATGSVLILHNVRNGNSGSYRCVVTNHCGSVISDAAALSIVF